MTDGSKSPGCRRRMERARVRGDIGLDDGKGRRALARLYDISLGGLCVHTQTPMTIGKVYRTAFETDADDKPLVLEGRVAWNRREVEYLKGPHVLNGLEFIALPEADACALTRFIEQRSEAIFEALQIVQPVSEFTEEEQAMVAAVAIDVNLRRGQILEPSEIVSALMIVRRGSLHYSESGVDDAPGSGCKVTAGQTCGCPPIDPRGPPKTRVVALQDAAVTWIPADGFEQLRAQSLSTAWKLLCAFTLSQLDRIRQIRPQLVPIS